MAKKATTKTKPKQVIATTEDLKKDEANPRKIKDSAAAGLSTSLKEFGDLSGIVFNQKTGQLIAGHQRMTQIEQRWGKQEIVIVDDKSGLHGIRIDDDHFFPVRVVNWTKAKQRAANVAANNQKLTGEFTDALDDYLLEIEMDLKQELGNSILDDLLLVDTSEPEKETPAKTVVSTHQVLVQCDDEPHQQAIYDELKGRGLDCKVLTL